MKLLLAIDHSDASKKAVRFVGDVLGKSAPKDLNITVLHVIESLPEFILQRKDDSTSGEAYRRVADEWSQTSKAEGERLLEEQKRTLVESGIPAESVATRLAVKEGLPEARKVVAALAIIDEMKSGDYSIVCVGRRGATAASGTFPGSVAEKVLREASGKTVWVVD